MKNLPVITLMIFAIAFSACQPPAKPKPKDPLEVQLLALNSYTEKQAYALGASIGDIVADKTNKQQKVGIELDTLLIVKGFIAGLQEKSQLSAADVQTLNRELDKQLKDKQNQLKIEQTKVNKEAGLAFLESNSHSEGIIQTESGLQYQVLRQGNGQSPKVSDTVTVNYLGTLLDGTVFDSSYARNKPATFPLTRVIKGWTEGLQLMQTGAKYKFFIPPELAYGARTTSKVPGYSTLIFEVELLEIIAAE
ncbi:FKBP-type peptidyl-prolyl cis-trans isomerase [Paraglaciecola sp. 2405UD69-4]|uniref:FKBP-type peptidyl-prolyl cis-trans isomerase n=1 Tax=Paraglaciecola sp. 2405UD69-4 TaxID=3391836 RepID=UPI0039C9E573